MKRTVGLLLSAAVLWGGLSVVARAAISLNPSSSNVTAVGEAFTVQVTDAANEGWTASNAVAWISLDNFTSTGGFSYGEWVGSGSFRLTALQNNSAVMRTGSVLVVDQVFAVSQAGTDCSFAVEPTLKEAVYGAGMMMVTVTTAVADCPWKVVNESPAWITVTNVTAVGGVVEDVYRGSGSVTLLYAANGNCGTRTGTVTVAGEAVSIEQGAMPKSIAPQNAEVSSAAGDDLRISVTTGVNCAWFPVEQDAWLVVTNTGPNRTYSAEYGYGAIGIGYFDVNYTENPLLVARTGTIAVADTVFRLTQRANTCSTEVSPTNFDVRVPDATNLAVSVTVNPDTCTWSASSQADWITLISPAQGSVVTNSGQVRFTVLKNEGCEARSSSITVGGWVIPVEQVAVTKSIAPAEQAVGYAAGNLSVAVTAGWECPWAVSENENWIAVTNIVPNYGYGGKGPGRVDVSFLENTTDQARTGTVVIADETFTLTQTGTSCEYTLSTNRFVQSDNAADQVRLTVTVSGGSCPWTAVPQVGWLSVSVPSGEQTATGPVQIEIAENTGCTQRTGTVLVAGVAVAIIQPAVTRDFSPKSFAPSFAGDSTRITVTSGDACRWYTETRMPWVLITNVVGSGAGNYTNEYGYSYAYGYGSGSLDLQVLPNWESTSERETSLTLMDSTFQITQEGNSCEYTLSTNRFDLADYEWADKTLEVQASSSVCPWSVSTATDWITILSPTSQVVGSDAVSLRIAINPDCDGRTGTVSVAGQDVTVTQLAKEQTVSPSYVGASYRANSQEIIVTSGAECFWDVTESEPWITISNTCENGYGYGCYGDGVLTLYLAENTGCSTRNGAVYVGNSVVTVEQSFLAQTVALNRRSVSWKGGDITATMTSGADCWYGVELDVPWIHITGGDAYGYGYGYSYSYKGSGSLIFSVFQNDTKYSRTGTLTIMDEIFNISQGTECSGLSFLMLLLDDDD